MSLEIPGKMRALVEDQSVSLLLSPRSTVTIRCHAIPNSRYHLSQNSQGKTASIQEVALPELEENDILVKVAYVAQNPTGT